MASETLSRTKRKILSNSDISELLALEAERATRDTAVKALRNASVAAMLWATEANELAAAGRLRELSGVGPFISALIAGWLNDPPDLAPRPDLRRSFMTLTEARTILARKPEWASSYRGDLQMHSTWSDGSATIENWRKKR